MVGQMLDTYPQINLFLDDGVLGWLLLFQWHSPSLLCIHASINYLVQRAKRKAINRVVVKQLQFTTTFE